MYPVMTRSPFRRAALAAVAACAVLAGDPVAADESLPFKQAVAEFAAGDDAVVAFYRDRDFAPVWTDETEAAAARRRAAFAAFAGAADHGLPANAYDAAEILSELRDVRGDRQRAEVEVQLTRAFLAYADDVGSGLLNPQSFEGIERSAPRRDHAELMRAFLAADPAEFVAGLPPRGADYARLLAAKDDFARTVALGGWGDRVPDGRKLQRGATGGRAAALARRLVAMQYLDGPAPEAFDARVAQAVEQFQADHGLAVDGVAGPATLAAINVPAEERLEAILVALERERWLNLDRGRRHVWVNLTDFTAKIVDDGRVTFETRSVVGMDADDRRSPEFSDEMDHMVVNPTWYVPRSIVVNEYLPMLQRNPYAVPQLVLVGQSGKTYGRQGFDFRVWNAQTFPFAMREPPSQGNALGQVKFMFPNKHNIYLHDTPAKSLFAKSKRDFSHGCIRLADPFGFAHAILERQSADPDGLFRSRLTTGRESRIDIEAPIPVHIVYRTAFTEARGRVQFRGDVYGRDARIWSALSARGVSLDTVQG